ncbi:MAG: hypothetical protein E7156_05340 [Streptococcus gallolyticus]|uniref:Uncharacterized protein n=1 Tax=Streptococcus gallolyticus TaxID=315405 RepID=A0A927XI24_9STRE|nr:hypothetical protein [Streptococcus gallolyticus]
MKRKKTLRQILLTLLIVFVLSLYGFIYVSQNLATYCIYYVKHMPQIHDKDTNPEMVVILDNLDYWGESTIEGLRYDTDGYNAIIKDETFSVRQGAFITSAKYEVSIYKGTDEEMYRLYFFDKSGKFYSYYYQKADVWKDVYDKSDIRRQEAQGYVDEVINPIVKKMEVKPKVNLQWLFNKKYQERFSDE